VALRNYAEGMRFSTYPAFGPAGTGGLALPGTSTWAAAGWQDAFSA
jgi:aspartate 1-decarboxylase